MSEAQHLLIGGILNDPSLIKQIDLLPEHFTDASSQIIYRACLEAHAKGLVVEPLSISEYLKEKTGDEWLLQVARYQTHSIALHAKSIPQYCEHIRREYVENQIKTICTIALQEKKTNLDNLIRDLMRLAETRKSNCTTLKEATRLAIDSLDRAIQGGGIEGITSGFPSLDEIISGYCNSDLVTIGGRASMGKTAFLVNSMLASGEPVGVISSEQNAEQIAQRALSMKSGVTLSKIRGGDVDEPDWARITNGVQALAACDVYINEKPRISIEDIARQAREWKYKNGIKALFVDYIQRITTEMSFSKKNEQVGEVAVSLKCIAKELNIPVIALAQVPRDVDNRVDKIPGIGDLCDSSEIEKESDIIMFVYRDEVYNAETDKKGLADIVVRKNRHGPCAATQLHFLGSMVKFAEVSNY